MRNLKIIGLEEVKIPAGLPLAATAWDTSNNSIICAFGPTKSEPYIQLKRKLQNGVSSEKDPDSEASAFISITSWDAPCPLAELEHDEILQLQFFSDISTACLVLAGGDIVLVREHPLPDQEKIEIVGSVDEGILAAAWASDEEVLAIVSRNDTLLLMSRDFESVQQRKLNADDLKASKQVSVGWGKKETQFQGKRAKALKDPTVPEVIDKGKSSTYEDGSVSISWRGDGFYVAVNSFIEGYRRAIRVFTREGVFDSVTEPVDGLESALSWRPAGNLIASTKRSADKVEVVFFERNGLRHGDFQLRLSASESQTWGSKISLSWNLDSTILAVSFHDRIQFWTMGNYHYYLKQEIHLAESAVDRKSSPIQWHPAIPLKCVLYTQETLMNLTTCFSVARGSVIPPKDYGVVMVIDGRTLKLTPLRHAVVPPPMSFSEISFNDNIVDCSISRNGDKIAVLTTKTLELCKWEMLSANGSAANGSHPKNYKYAKIISNRSFKLPHQPDISSAIRRYTRLIISNNDDIFVLAPQQTTYPASCVQLPWSANETDADFSKIEIPELIQDIFSDNRDDALWLADGKCVRKLVVNQDALEQKPNNTYKIKPYSEIIVLTIPVDPQKALESPDNSLSHPVILTPNGNLDVDGKVIARNCTSFLLTGDHIIFTTTSSLLKFVHITNPTNLQVPEDTPEVDERCRSIERGAKLVTVIPSSYAVVLQMPRGNLEMIYPRLLVLSGIRKHLQQHDYRSAFLACQSHQVDMNIIHDYDPDTFMHNVSHFIDQLKKVSRVDEFLSKIKEEDVTTTLYRDTLPQSVATSTTQLNGTDHPTMIDHQPNAAPILVSGKANSICDEFLKVLPSKSPIYRQNMITAHVRKRPPDLNSALLQISSLRESSHEDADLAVSHLCFLTDSNRLYDAALALYDLELTLLVAQNAQRDPREYMPFLQSLQVMSEHQRRFKIDDHLRKYSKALESLHAMASHDELESYATKHHLYSDAIKLYKYDEAHLANIRRLYADHLNSQSQHTAAAVLYESLKDYSSAFPLYALAHQWRESLTCASLIPLDEDRLRNLAKSLATTCADESRDYRAAATIHIEYLNDIPAAARFLCRGSYFAEATRILAFHHLHEEISTIVNQGLNEKFSEIIELVADCKSQLTAQLPRIDDLRKKKQEDPLAFYGGEATSSTYPNGDEPDIPDNISLAPTDASTHGGQSLFTRYGSNASKFGGTVASNVSRKTSRTKRREERKRARGKKGSVYEEEYIVASVARLIDRVNGVHDEVKRLVSGLLRQGMHDQAEKVEEIMLEISDMCSSAKLQVWKENDTGNTKIESRSNNLEADEGLSRPSGADGVFWDSQMGVDSSRSVPPEVKKWSRNILLT